MGLDTFHIGEASGTRMRQSYHLWMLQRVYQELDSLTEGETNDLRLWLGRWGNTDWMSQRPSRRLMWKGQKMVPEPVG